MSERNIFRAHNTAAVRAGRLDLLQFDSCRSEPRRSSQGGERTVTDVVIILCPCLYLRFDHDLSFSFTVVFSRFSPLGFGALSIGQWMGQCCPRGAAPTDLVDDEKRKESDRSERNDIGYQSRPG